MARFPVCVPKLKVACSPPAAEYSAPLLLTDPISAPV
jgi:hypothetical protein